MRYFALAALYTALVMGANTGAAQDLDALTDIRAGDMRKLIVHSEPSRSSDAAFVSADGSEMTLAAYEGQFVVLNFWATWCAPCREEMPHLSALQEAVGGEDIQVVTIATGRNPPPAIVAFFAEIGVDNLPLYRDPRQDLARDMGVLGLPATLILDRNGFEIARLQGEANWADENALAMIEVLLAE